MTTQWPQDNFAAAEPVRGLVSVVIPAFRAEKTIERAIVSVRAQSHRPFEIIVVNDASTDGTVAVLSEVQGSDIIVVSLDKNVGAGEARNIGIRRSRGEYVAFLDADDEWHPEKLARQMACAASNPNAAMIITDATMTNPDGSSWRFHERCPPTSGSDAWKALLARNFVPTPTVLARRDVLLTLDGFKQHLIIGEDLDLWIRLSEHGVVAVVPETLATVHIRPDSLLRSNPTGERDFVMPMVEGHIVRFGDRLSATERRRIRGIWAFEVAYQLYRQGMFREALPLFWRSAKRGQRVIKSISFFPRAAFRITSRAATNFWSSPLIVSLNEIIHGG